MWHFRIPPFAGHPGIPDPGLTTGDWPTLLLTAAIAVAAVAQAFIAYRLWRPQVLIRVRLRVEPPQPNAKRADSITGKGYIDVSNLSPLGIWIEKFDVTAQWNGQLGLPTVILSKELIAAYNMRAFPVEKSIFEALVTIPELARKDRSHGFAGSVTAVLYYNAHGKDLKKSYSLGQVLALFDGTLVVSLRS